MDLLTIVYTSLIPLQSEHKGGDIPPTSINKYSYSKAHINGHLSNYLKFQSWEEDLRLIGVGGS